jgi:uncharacterized membrane protein YccC
MAVESHLKTVLVGTAHVERGKIVWKMPLRSSIVIVLLLAAFLAAGRPMEAIPVAIGALFASVADVGEHVGHRWRTMLWTTMWLMIACATGDAVSDFRIILFVASAAAALLAGFAGAIGTRASLIGVLSLVVFTIFAGTPEVPWEFVPNALLMGLGGVVQTAVTCIPPLIRNRQLIHKPDDAGFVLPRMREHLHAKDPFVRHAVRLAIAILAATVIEFVIQHPHAYWIPMTVAWVARPDHNGTVSKVAARMIGTLIGLVLVAATIWAFGWSEVGIVLIIGGGSMLALAFIWANYAIAVAGVTTFVIALFSLIGDPVRATLPIRALDTFIAGVITVAASYIWRDTSP